MDSLAGDRAPVTTGCGGVGGLRGGPDTSQSELSRTTLLL
jgi:hypothetical protein